MKPDRNESRPLMIFQVANSPAQYAEIFNKLEEEGLLIQSIFFEPKQGPGTERAWYFFYLDQPMPSGRIAMPFSTGPSGSSVLR